MTGPRQSSVLWSPLLVLGFTAFAIETPFFFFGTPSGHDVEFHLYSWLEVLGQWKQGIIYPRWASLAHFGYGEPRFVFYPPASWMLGSALTALFPWTIAATVYIWIVMVAAGLSMLMLARSWVNRRDALFDATVSGADLLHLDHRSHCLHFDRTGRLRSVDVHAGAQMAQPARRDFCRSPLRRQSVSPGYRLLAQRIRRTAGQLPATSVAVARVEGHGGRLASLSSVGTGAGRRMAYKRTGSRHDSLLSSIADAVAGLEAAIPASPGHRVCRGCAGKLSIGFLSSARHLRTAMGKHCASCLGWIPASGQFPIHPHHGCRSRCLQPHHFLGSPC